MRFRPLLQVVFALLSTIGVLFWFERDTRISAEAQPIKVAQGSYDLYLPTISRVESRGITTRVSSASDGTQANDSAFGFRPAISADGRFVAFTSAATNLVPGDDNAYCWNGRFDENCDDVFVHDRLTGETSLVSVNEAGEEGNHASSEPAISGDGRYIAFTSSARNLLSGPPSEAYCPEGACLREVYVRDQETGRISLISATMDGTMIEWGAIEPAISGDGRFVAFVSPSSKLVTGDTNDKFDVFVHDRETEHTTRVSIASDGVEGDNSSFLPSISEDGRFVAFSSLASNLVADDTNNSCPILYTAINCSDVFVHDRETGQTTRVSVASDGSQGDEASGGVYGSLTTSPPPSISADGRYVAFASEATNLVDGDTNNAPDAFVHDRETGETTRVSVSSDGSQANARSSWGYASSLDLSGDGRYVVFQSDATNFVPDEFRGRADLYLHDRATGETRLIAVSSTGEAANYSGDYPVISQDGHFVAFLSKASNLVPGDTNDQWDVFVHEPDLP